MSSLGHDLASVRKQQNLTLEEVQTASKIPMVTLQAIEDDSIFEKSEENSTYIRSFVRSYAKVLKIDDERVLASLDAVEKNNYQGELLEKPDRQEEKPPKKAAQLSKKPIRDSSKKQGPDKNKRDYRNAPEPPTIHSINWADLGKKFIIPDNKSRVWLLISAIFLLILTVGGLAFYFGGSTMSFDLSGSNGTETTDSRTQPPAQLPVNPGVQDPEFTEDTLQAQPSTPLANQNVSQNGESQVLGDTLSLVVYAAYDKLDPVRITSDLSWRTNPYWMEQGEAYYFDFKDTVLVRGQYSQMLLLLNGHIIENFRQNYFDPSFNSVMLTRSIFEDNAVFTQPAPIDFPLAIGPPDSIIYPTVF